MENLFKQYKIDINSEKKEKFEEYYNILIDYNEKFNITAITDKEDVYKKHFIDSLLGVEFITGKKMIDIGSGGGFPALPIKIEKEDLNLTLLEATDKKCGFLREVIKLLKLKDVEVINGRAEDLAKDKNFREQFDVCTARAVARLNILVEYCLPFIKVGGVFVSFKGDAEEEILEAKSAIETLGGKIKTIKNYELDGAKRTLVVIEKVKNTDIKYPRINGKIRKNPL